MQSIASLMSMKAPVEEDIGNLDDFEENGDQPDKTFDRTEASLKISELAAQIGLFAETSTRDFDLDGNITITNICCAYNKLTWYSTPNSFKWARKQRSQSIRRLRSARGE